MADICSFAIFADTICRYGAFLTDIIYIEPQKGPQYGFDIGRLNIDDTNTADKPGQGCIDG